jgi:actin related protein 2/3 complex subunit 2
MAKQLKGMIFVEDSNKIIEECLTKSFTNLRDHVGKRMEPMDVTVSDFDETSYHIVVDPSNKDEMMISVGLYSGVAQTLMDVGGQNIIDKDYAGYQVPDTETGFDVTFKIDANELFTKSDEEKMAIMKKFANLKRNLVGAPFEHSFEALRKGGDNFKALQPTKLAYRPTESIYLVPNINAIHGDRVVIVFEFDFSDITEAAFCKVFLQEFCDEQRKVNNAPPLTYTKDPPKELLDSPFAGQLTERESLVGYLSVACFESHVNSTQKMDNVVGLLQGLRTYMLYHIKATKSYMHSRMRKCVVGMLQVLNRAIPEHKGPKKEKKTAAGKAFTRN